VLTERTREKPDAIRVRDDTGCAAMTQADTEYLALTQDSAVYSYVIHLCPLQDGRRLWWKSKRAHGLELESPGCVRRPSLPTLLHAD
jgi:hypothetical protein